MLGERYLKVADRDEMVFTAICEFMVDCGGMPPKLDDLVGMLNKKLGLPNEKQKSVGKSSISKSVHKLKNMGLLRLRIPEGGGIRSAGSIRITDSRFYIDAKREDVREAIENFYEERLGSKRNSSK